MLPVSISRGQFPSPVIVACPNRSGATKKLKSNFWRFIILVLSTWVSMCSATWARCAVQRYSFGRARVFDGTKALLRSRRDFGDVRGHGGRFTSTGSAWRWPYRRRQNLLHFRIAYLREFGVPFTDGVERFRNSQANTLIGFGSQTGAGLRRTHRGGHNQPLRMKAANMPCRGSHRRARRQPVVHQHNGLAGEAERRTADPVKPFAAL